MSDLAISFASLVKTNNGMFKSSKQAAFLLSQCQEASTFYASGAVYNNGYTLAYVCDEQGVIQVKKSTKNKDSVTWDRLAATDFEVVASNKASKQALYVIYKAKESKFRKVIEAANSSQKLAMNKFMSAFSQASDQAEFCLDPKNLVNCTLSAKRTKQVELLNASLSKLMSGFDF